MLGHAGHAGALVLQMGLEWHSRAYPQRLPLNGRGKPEPAGILDGTPT